MATCSLEACLWLTYTEEASDLPLVPASEWEKGAGKGQPEAVPKDILRLEQCIHAAETQKVPVADTRPKDSQTVPVAAVDATMADVRAAACGKRAVAY